MRRVPDSTAFLVENTFSLDIRPLVRAGALRYGLYAEGTMELPGDDKSFALTFEVSTRDRANCWMRVRGTIPDWWDGRRDVDDEFSLDTVRHPGGGRRGQAGLRNLQAPDRCPPFRWYASRHSPLTELRLQLVAAGRAGKAAGGIVVFRSVLTGRRGLRRNDPSSGGRS
jgi:hypothetical protein